MSVPAVPRATYRLQLSRAFGFAAAADLVSYLAQLGISHAYCSPYLKARAGSPHGYDIVDHNALNPELGGAEAFETFCAALAHYDMGQILDLVPNHMGVGGDDNAWWLEVLEHGPAAPHAEFFDIDWSPVKQALRGKVLLPVLGEHYGLAIEGGRLRLGFDAAAGRFSLRYYHHHFPIDPGTYPEILDAGALPAAPGAGTGTGDPGHDLAVLAAAFDCLPPRVAAEPEQRARRLAAAARLQRELAALCARVPAVRAHIEARVAAMNGRVGDAASFDALHTLLERQAYRLAYWQVAADEINYRRFFDINELAGLRMERDEVFDTVHALVLELAGQGCLAGLRIDHPDGLYDPDAYYRKLAAALSERRPADAPPFYLVIEKILALHEHVPEGWPVAGTTGYEFSRQLNALLVDPAGERPLTRQYVRFTGMGQSFDELLYTRKHLVIRRQLSSDLTVLTNMLDTIAQLNRETRDYTLNGLREALTEITACFPVYRTYVTEAGPSATDRRHVDWAIAQAIKRSTVVDAGVFGFIRAVLLLEAGPRPQVLRFAMKFQQYTAPVMAKAMEDTAFYIYNRLVSLNEVGSDPRSFSLTISGFHHLNQERLRRFPHAMLGTSTHDSKRSEDVRARIDVLSEVADEWRRHLTRWARLNRGRKRLVNNEAAPSRNDEYLIYQTLLGIWPLPPAGPPGLAAAELDDLEERLEIYLIKAVREAKTYTSWVNPNAEYEAAVKAFLRALLRRPERNAFLADFTAFAARITPPGLYNGLTQVVLKLCSPGVPDIYQGNELWTFQLVDPDNRRPVDFVLRQRLLRELAGRFGDDVRPCGPALRGLLDDLPDGRVKLYLTWRGLQLRALHPALFRDGEYLPLEVTGVRADQVCAFARRSGGLWAVVVAPRCFTRLCGGPGAVPLGPEVWGDTALVLPPEAPAAYQDRLSGESPAVTGDRGTRRLALGGVLGYFPVALLLGTANPPDSAAEPRREA
jgi:(1->4)-alpha-D-glucan 1-alpha-D-glucosylmutase